MTHKTDMREALQLCIDAMLHDGVPTDPYHPRQVALTAAENALASRPDAQESLASENVVKDSTPKVSQGLAQADERGDLLHAALNCPHEIDSNRVVLHYDGKQAGCNALAQLGDRLARSAAPRDAERGAYEPGWGEGRMAGREKDRASSPRSLEGQGASIDYDGVVSICDAHGIALPVDCIEMVVEIIRHAATSPNREQVGGWSDSCAKCETPRACQYDGCRAAPAGAPTVGEHVGATMPGVPAMFYNGDTKRDPALRELLNRQASRQILTNPRGDASRSRECTCGGGLGHTRSCPLFDESMMRYEPFPLPSSEGWEPVRAALADLVKAVDWWAAQEDGIPDHAWDAYGAALKALESASASTVGEAAAPMVDRERWEKVLSFAKGIISRLDTTEVMCSSVNGIAYDAAERAVFIRNLAAEALAAPAVAQPLSDGVVVVPREVLQDLIGDVSDYAASREFKPREMDWRSALLTNARAILTAQDGVLVTPPLTKESNSAIEILQELVKWVSGECTWRDDSKGPRLRGIIEAARALLEGKGE